MRIFRVCFVCGFLVLVGALSASADIKGPNGEKCNSTEPNVKHDIKGKHYTCDKCVFSKCDTSGKAISNCQIVTHWVNCVEASPPAKK
jgi:hypothetical protein